MEENVLKTPLHDRHLALKALMAPFGGFDMPIQYAGILAEHKQCREAAALFDICHMGEFLLKGDPAAAGLDALLSFAPSKLPVGKCKYGFMLDDNGRVLDDLIVYRLAEAEFMVVVNAATTTDDFQYLSTALNSGTDFTNISEKTGKLDLQGPASRDVMVSLFGEQVKSIPYFQSGRVTWQGETFVVSRTGYTGELGYELYPSSALVTALWDKLLADERVKPAGLGARDILRLEVGYSLYGSDIDRETTPVEADLLGFIDLKREFKGRDALLKQQDTGCGKVKIAFKTTSRRSPRQHYRVVCNGKDIGEVTSGAFSPILSCGIGLAFVKPAFAAVGQKIIVKNEGVEIEGVVTTLPFFTGGSIRN